MSRVLPCGACSRCGRRDSRPEFRRSRQRNGPWAAVGGVALASTRSCLGATPCEPVMQIQMPKLFSIRYSCSARRAFRRGFDPGDSVSRRQLEARRSDQLDELSWVVLQGEAASSGDWQESARRWLGAGAVGGGPCSGRIVVMSRSKPRRPGGGGQRRQGLVEKGRAILMLSSSSSKRGSRGVAGRGRRCSWRKRKARKGGGSDGMQAKFQVRLVQGLLLQFGGT